MSGTRTAADAALSVGDYTEATLGAALADAIDSTFRRDHRIDAWRYFDSPRWRRDEQGRILRRAQTFLEDRIGFTALDGDLSTDRSQTIRALTKHLNARSMGNLVKIAGCQPAIALTGAEFDVDPALCGVQNGVLELRDEARFRSGNPRDYLTLACGVPFDPTAECPTWRRFVDQITQGDPALIDFLQRAHGSELSGD